MQEPARSALVHKAFRLAWLTAGWMTVEAAVAVGTGMAAHSLTLLAFGADSIIELLSAGVLLWRLNVELRHGTAFSEGVEQRASTMGGALLVALTAYVIASAAWSLWRGEGQAFSLPGLLLAVVAMPVMSTLAKGKLRMARKMGSAALRADAAESIACLYLAAVVVVGQALQGLVNAWWLDGVSALALVPFLLREAYEAWQGDAEDD